MLLLDENTSDDTIAELCFVQESDEDTQSNETDTEANQKFSRCGEINNKLVDLYTCTDNNSVGVNLTNNTNINTNNTNNNVNYNV